jgi:hypothetical protein
MEIADITWNDCKIARRKVGQKHGLALRYIGVLLPEPRTDLQIVGSVHVWIIHQAERLL